MWFKIAVLVLQFMQLGALGMIANNQVLAYKAARGSK